MSTRALYTFKDESGEYHVYKHHDGYPTGGLAAILNAKKLAWELPRFEADEFAAAFVAANKTDGGGVRLTTGKTWGQAASSDIEYHYVVTCENGELYVEINSTHCWKKPTQKVFARGTLDAMIVWAETEDAA